MAVKANTLSALTPFQKKILQDYQKRNKKYKVHCRNAHLTIKKSFLDWLAQPQRRERYNLEVMPSHEQVELVEKIVVYLQERRTNKANETRERNKKRVLEQIKKDRQSTFNFTDSAIS